MVKAPLLGSCFTVGDTIRIFGEFFLCQSGGNTALTKVLYRNAEFLFTTPDDQLIPFFKAAAGLDPLTAQLDLTAFHGFAGKRAGPEEPRGP